jgi:hypothetical protein
MAQKLLSFQTVKKFLENSKNQKILCNKFPQLRSLKGNA